MLKLFDFSHIKMTTHYSKREYFFPKFTTAKFCCKPSWTCWFFSLLCVVLHHKAEENIDSDLHLRRASRWLWISHADTHTWSSEESRQRKHAGGAAHAGAVGLVGLSSRAGGGRWVYEEIQGGSPWLFGPEGVWATRHKKLKEAGELPMPTDGWMYVSRSGPVNFLFPRSERVFVSPLVCLWEKVGGKTEGIRWSGQSAVCQDSL